QTTAQEWNLKGNVKSIHESLYDYVDNNGQMEKGNLITGASPLYEFDQAGNLISKTEYSDDKSPEIWKTKYSKPGLMTEEALYNSKGKLLRKAVYGYDQNDIRIKFVYYDSLGKISEHYTVEHKVIDENKYVDIRDDYDGKEKCTVIDTFVYFNNTRLKYRTTAFKDYFSKTQYFYDRGGHMIRYIIENEKGIRSHSDLTYDSQGNIIKKIHGESYTNPDIKSIPDPDSVATYEYTYDAQGNWTKKITLDSSSDFLNSIIERTITYY
ncbi:MAG: hypothetical protein WAT91_00145, partial [Saprospiraceae bacterium]